MAASAFPWYCRPSAIKKERRIQGRSLSPDQEALQNSTWPTLPFGSAVQAPLLKLEGPFGPAWSVSGKQFLTLARRSNCRLDPLYWGNRLIVYPITPRSKVGSSIVLNIPSHPPVGNYCRAQIIPMPEGTARMGSRRAGADRPSLERCFKPR